MNTPHMVYVLDGDAGVRKSLSWMLECKALAHKSYESAAAFLEEVEVKCPTCLILDIQLPGTSGMEVLKEIMTHPHLLMPVILTGAGSIAQAVACIKMGAFDFLEKPIDQEILLERVQESLRCHATRRAQSDRRAMLKCRLDQLTQREREVLGLLREGHSSKQIATRLKISIKTVAIHRWHLLKKMQAGSATEAVHLALRATAA